jgi:TonB family protein
VAAVLIAFLTQVASRSSDYLVYQIELVSPPPMESPDEVPASREEELVVETPLEPPVEEAPPVPEPEVRQEEVVSEPERTEPDPVEEAEAARPETGTEESGEDLNVRMEGLRRDYPAYYANIIRQIRRCFRWQGTGNSTATVRFTIERDGSVSDLHLHRRSGVAAFDFEAMGAVECAGSGGRLGPLPPELPYDRLPVEFTFEPVRRRDGGVAPSTTGPVGRL